MAYKCPVQQCNGKCFKSNKELFRHGEFTHKPLLKVYVCPCGGYNCFHHTWCNKVYYHCKQEHQGQPCANKFNYIMVKNNNFIDPGYHQLGDVGCYKLPMEGKRIYSDNTEIPEMPNVNRYYETESYSTKSGQVEDGKIYLDLHKKDLEDITKAIDQTEVYRTLLEQDRQRIQAKIQKLENTA